jgi:hypothetical protein
VTGALLSDIQSNTKKGCDMKSKHFYLILNSLLVCTCISFAEENLSEASATTLPSIDIAVDNASEAAVPSNMQLFTNAAMIRQSGERCNAEISQFNTVDKGDPNLAYIVQVGSDNEASIAQCGEDNVNAITQCGRNNSGVQETDGVSNRSVLHQSGDNNQSVQILEGNRLCSEVIQNGNDNQVYRVETGTNGLPCRITQNGDGMKMTIVVGN